MNRITRRLAPLLPFFLLVLSACDNPTELEGSCLAVVNVQGVFFTLAEASATSEEISEAPYLTITRNTGCLDQGQVARELAHGESNFLAVGSTLHTVAGFEASEGLAYYAPVVEEWVVLVPTG